MSVLLIGLGRRISGKVFGKWSASASSMRVSMWVCVGAAAGLRVRVVGSGSSWPKPGAVRAESFMSRERWTRV